MSRKFVQYVREPNWKAKQDKNHSYKSSCKKSKKYFFNCLFNPFKQRFIIPQII